VAAVIGAPVLVLTAVLSVDAYRCCPDTLRSPRQDVVAVDTPPARPAGVRAATAKAIGGGLLVAVEGRRLVASEATGSAPVFAVDLDELGLDTGGEVMAVSIRPYDGGVVLAWGATTTVLAHDGTPRWLLTTGAETTRVVVADPDRIVMVGSHSVDGDLLQVVETAEGRVRFERPVDALVGVEEQTALVRDVGQVAGVTAVSLVDGSVRWASPASSTVRGGG
jgi:hypothetical protein